MSGFDDIEKERERIKKLLKQGKITREEAKEMMEETDGEEKQEYKGGWSL